MQTLDIVTGGGTGIGRGIALALAAEGRRVLVVGRRGGPLESVAAEAAPAISTLAADVATEQGRADVVAAVGESAVGCLVHNAALLEPVGPLAEVTAEAWRTHMAVNLDAPLFLTQALLPRLAGGRVLMISSGAAHRSIPGWGAYCTSKAALFMLGRVLADELGERQVAVGSLRPGVVDTPMQGLIRSQSPERFPQVEQFRALKSDGRLNDPEAVGRFAAALLLRAGATEFAAGEWDFTEHASRFPS